MFAIVNIKGKQYRITENQRLFVPKLNEKTGSKVSFPEVLVFSKDDKSLEIGSPSLKINVHATVLKHVKDEKVIVFKKKRRKGYKRTKGHRQEYTEIEINRIGQKAKEGEKIEAKESQKGVQKIEAHDKKTERKEKSSGKEKPKAKAKRKEE